jgi:hypothetical protein
VERLSLVEPSLDSGIGDWHGVLPLEHDIAVGRSFPKLSGDSFRQSSTCLQLTTRFCALQR